MKPAIAAAEGSDTDLDSLARQHGVEDGWSCVKPFEVRWDDIDAFGHVNHRTHLLWCEEARNHYFRELGEFPFGIDRPGPVIREVSFSYDRPLGLEDSVLVAAKVDWIRSTSFRMAFSVWSHGIVGRGSAICIWMRNDSGSRVPLPDSLRALILAKDNATDARN
ncbi:acyl-CoA thioesterase [Paraburkholderia sp. J12]|uniref:acyl-CoA thioesterase n=1 Tax=Paraburkholderia sp. J12 TaxID=2805432 RepID=UPI0039F5D3B8